jgi:glycosyltransferase involved in cell wall biosynthesis
MKFSIVIVTFNAKNNIEGTVESILSQTCSDYEVVIKDGGSTDGTIEYAEGLAASDNRFSLYEEPDKGIYDAMNQAVTHAKGDFVIFLNAGDRFYDEHVLEKTANLNPGIKNTILYGDAYFESVNSMNVAPPKITGFVCYRNVPCHQAILYSRDTLTERPFDTSLKIRADFEHFNDAYFNKKRDFLYLGFPVCLYEGGGFSENAANKARDREEYLITVRRHIPAVKRFLYRAILVLTMQKLRTRIANNPKMSKAYQNAKAVLYKR